MKIRLLRVGKDRSGLFDPAAQEYAKRLGHYAQFEEVTLEASRRREADRARAEEADAIFAKLKGDETLVAVDQRGRALDSVELANALGRAQGTGRGLAFVIGGDEGLADSVRQKAAWSLSLSRMTLPHRLARVVLLEQLYRGFTILRGEPYHR
jgi:23S rRNA (pseudouridine1915-N3)-methyltransferase